MVAAEALCRQILLKSPKQPDALHLLGLIAHKAGRLDAAERLIADSLAIDSSVASRHNNLGIVLRAEGKLEQAIAAYEKALSLKPDYAAAYYNLGNVLHIQGKHEEAISSYRKALDIKPDYAEVHNCLGVLLQGQGRFDEAAEAYQRALSIDPNSWDAHNNMGNLLMVQGRLGEALEFFGRALALRPDYRDALNNMGNSLLAQGRMEEALASYQRMQSLSPKEADVNNNLANLCLAQGKVDEAIGFYRRALSINPRDSATHQNLLLALNYLYGNDGAVMYAEHRAFARQHEGHSPISLTACDQDRSRDARLRVGYVSPDFRKHSVAFFLEPVLRQHDHSRFEIFCYYNHPTADDVTARLRGFADHWTDIVGVSDEDVARKIRRDRIDILVDLAGHTAMNRLLVFARKPAPVQFSWLGYPNTTGLSAMDYRISDGRADPVGETENYHTEEVIRLPECFCCYSPPPECPEVNALPARKNGHITFGSFNAAPKITKGVVAAWARLLVEIPRSRLVIKYNGLQSESQRRLVFEAFATHSVSADRLRLYGRDAVQAEHMSRYWEIDIGLDTFPYNGTTTTCDALWMGAPVVVMEGRTHVARVGVSLLSVVGLPELVARDLDDYVAVAVRLAGDLDRLERVRSTLRERVAASPLADSEGFTRHLEHAYTTAWERWCAGSNVGPGAAT